MAVTLSDVASAAGMSLPATSQILNGKGSYRAETIARVQAAARSLGYQPNVYAQAMARRSFGAYALLQSDNPSSSLMPRGMLAGFNAALAPKGLHLVMAFLPDRELTDVDAVPKILSHVLADGLLINYNAGYPAMAVKLLAEKGVPSVWLNVDHPTNAVMPDDFGGGRMIAEHLVAHGHRRLAWFDLHVGPGQNSLHYSTAARRDGFLAGAPGATVLGLRKDAPMSEIAVYLREVLQSSPRPTAIGCYSESEAHLVLAEALRLGLECPRDLSIGLVNDRISHFGGLSLDTWVLDIAQQTRVAADMLGRLVDGERNLPAVAVPLRHVSGGSVQSLV
jgi:LacI family transcriptional regulator